MILILPILIYYSLACQTTNEIRSIYPTVGETFQLEMSEIFSGQCNSYQCDGCTNQISIYNATEIVVQNALNKIILSVTTNETHFAALTNLNLIIYKQGNVSEKYQNLFKLPQNMSCNNVIYTQPDTILLDCYQESQLIFLQFYDNNFNYVYNSSSYTPQSTQIETYFNFSQQIFVLYAQYYQNYSILTLLSNQNNSDQIYQNLSVCKQQNFTEFHSSFQFIYLLQNKYIFQIYIDSQFQFINLTNQYFISISTFSVYRSLKNNGDCDNIIVISFFHSEIMKYLACQSYIQSQSSLFHRDLKIQKSIKCISNNNFLIIIVDQKELYILSNGQYFKFLQTIQITKTTKLILNIFSNVLYVFQQQFIELQIRIPALIINGQEFTQNGTKITIYAQKNNTMNQTQTQQKSTINIQILQKQDTNIYVQFQNKKFVNFLDYNQYQYQYQNIDNYSGQLLKIQVNQYNKTKNLGQYYQTTLNQFLNVNVQDSSLCAILTIPPWYIYIEYQQILVLVKNKSLIFKSCYIKSNNCFIKNIFNSLSPIEQLQLSYNFLGKKLVLIAGIQINSNIINCIYYNLTQIKYQNQVIGSDQFLSYLLTYDGLYILFSNSSISFYNNCTQSQVITIDQQSINEAFNQSKYYSFIPTNITTNVQYLSSLLYINNQTNVIIITLINKQLIPIQRIQSKNNQIIYGINLINDRLILSFYNNQTLNFEVWNLFNIYQPYFEKNLFEISLYNLIKIFSDNLFLYVQFNSNQLYIYNPALSQHSALLLNQTLNSSLICSTAVIYPQSYNLDDINLIHRFGQEYLQSILLINSNLYTIYPINQINFIINKTFERNAFYPQVNYNISISNYFSKQSINESTKILIYLYNFLNIQPDSLNVQYNYSNKIATILPISSQLSYCTQQDKQCSYYQDSNQKCFSDQSYLINFIDNQIFYIDKNSSIYQFDKISINQSCSYSLIIDGTNNKMDNCSASITHNYFIFAICSNTISSYLIIFNFTNISNPVQLAMTNLQNKFKKVGHMQIVQDSLFFTARKIDIVFSLYVFNQNNNSYYLHEYNIFMKNFITIPIKFLFQQYYIVTYLYIQRIYCLLMNSKFEIQNKPVLIVFDFFQIKEIYFESLTLIQQKDNNMIALLGTNYTQYPLLMFHFQIEINSSSINLLTMVEYLKFLPAQEQLNLDAVFLNGYLIITYIYLKKISISIYSLEDYQNLQNDLLSPILLQKQIYMENMLMISHQVRFNINSNLITYVLFGYNLNVKTGQQTISQHILQINPNLQLICQFDPKFIECCSGNPQYTHHHPDIPCTKIQIQQPIFILNLILPAILIVYLLSVLYRMVFGKLLRIQDDQEENNIEL